MDLNIGDIVQIVPLSDEQKASYPGGWAEPMNQYIGTIIKIDNIRHAYDRIIYDLECDRHRWKWSDCNLISIHKKMSLF